MNKPLTKLEREEIVARIARGEYNSREASHHAEADILLLISAEAFWQEIVKKFPENIFEEEGPYQCLFCQSPDYRLLSIKHTGNCPWFNSQEPT